MEFDPGLRTSEHSFHSIIESMGFNCTVNVCDNISEHAFQRTKEPKTHREHTSPRLQTPLALCLQITQCQKCARITTMGNGI
jgi:hypothetical protein